MRLNCNINGTAHSLVVNSDKPLSKILKEIIVSFEDNSQCLGASCGNCIVLIDGNATLSCLVPAFKANGASIVTFEGFQKTRMYHDIERAYQDMGNQPCPQCYASKTMIIESILIKMDKENQTKATGMKFIPQASQKAKANNTEISASLIAREMALSSCQCIETSELDKIINLAYKYRSRRRARRS